MAAEASCLDTAMRAAMPGTGAAAVMLPPVRAGADAAAFLAWDETLAPLAAQHAGAGAHVGGVVAILAVLAASAAIAGGAHGMPGAAWCWLAAMQGISALMLLHVYLNSLRELTPRRDADAGLRAALSVWAVVWASAAVLASGLLAVPAPLAAAAARLVVAGPGLCALALLAAGPGARPGDAGPLGPVLQGPVLQGWTWRYLRAKRAMDVTVAAALLTLLAPMLLLLGLGVRLGSAGPALFIQARSGAGGLPFGIVKFRTMARNAAGGQCLARDARVTPLGRVLRATCLDELPQLANVLRGDMSLVGPRPHAEALHAADLCAAGLLGSYMARYAVRPGMTGLAQISGARGPAHGGPALARRLSLDLRYMEEASLRLDLRILALTPWAVLGGKIP